ncbi:dehydrogenase [bacterium SCGC AG-212-C10]|nr:dehydrogenase [bacterium SCGC AG-212-C10]
MRFIGLLRATAASEAGAPPTQEMLERMGAFVEEIAKAGVLVATDGLHPSSSGVRVKLENGKRTIVDGPFTESKELIASYAIVDVDSRDEAVEWTSRFLEVLGGGECEVRQIFDPADFGPEFTPEERAREDRVRAEMARRQ